MYFIHSFQVLCDVSAYPELLSSLNICLPLRFVLNIFTFCTHTKCHLPGRLTRAILTQFHTVGSYS